jgi:hypothetical protein
MILLRSTNFPLLKSIKLIPLICLFLFNLLYTWPFTCANLVVPYMTIDMNLAFGYDFKYDFYGYTLIKCGFLKLSRVLLVISFCFRYSLRWDN